MNPLPMPHYSQMKMQKVTRWLCYFFLCAMVLAGCTAGNPAENQTDPELIVFAAASLTNAFEELGEAFAAQEGGTPVVFNFGGSSQLATQLNEGIPADIFAPANDAQMQVVVDEGRITAESVVPFVSNRLTVIVPAANPAGITALEDLAQSDVQLILATVGVPVRDYTDEIVAAFPADFQQAFYANLVSEEENVRQVAAKIALSEADAGIVYTSDVTPDIAGRVQQIEIPNEQNVIASYPIAPLVDAPRPELAQRFIEFITSTQGQAILAKWGFAPPVR